MVINPKSFKNKILKLISNNLYANAKIIELKKHQRIIIFNKLYLDTSTFMKLDIFSSDF
jgi:hypothetical protein